MHPKISLSAIPTCAPGDLDEGQVRKETAQLVKKLGDLQQKMYAEGKHALLVVFQGMDGSGKDGAIHRVFDACRITGLTFSAFKKPSETEFAHDFLWRVHQAAPARGMIGLFNRSHYEDILIQWVHGWIDDDKRSMRMEAINAFEKLLSADNQTHIVKFYLHISKEEQEKQLLERMREPEKHWKHNPADWEERKYWDRYMEAYEYALNNSHIPWNICPCDDRWYRDYYISRTLVEFMEKLPMEFPDLQH